MPRQEPQRSDDVPARPDGNGRPRLVPPAARIRDERDEILVAAEDVAALLNRIGDCVRELPSYGRARALDHGAVAKRTLSAISTCSLDKLAEDDRLRPVLARVAATRQRADPWVSGVERIAAARRLQDDADPAPEARWLPACTYLLTGGHVIRRAEDEAGAAHGEDIVAACDELIDDLALAGALIASEIDRLQRLQQHRRHA